MRDIDLGKRKVEGMILEQMLESFEQITGRIVTDGWESDFLQVEGSPDFILGFDGKALGIELAEVRRADSAWTYYETASQIAWKKHESYARRGLFANPIVLVLYADEPPLFDIRHELSGLVDEAEFEPTGFAEVWAIDLSAANYTPGHPFRRADMFCFKPRATFGFHRVGEYGRKPYG